MAGLLAARRLSRSSDVVVVDKGRGVGGRLATRRIGDATFDHGAQFLTTHTPEFAELVAGWERAGVARPWFRGRSGPDGVIDDDGHTRFRGVPTMNVIAKHLAQGLQLRLGARVVALCPAGAGWRIELEDGTVLAADAVVLTAPVPQALALLAAGAVGLSTADGRALEAIRYEPCLAVLAVLDGASGLDGPGAVTPSAGPVAWMADNASKGVSRVPAVTIHAAADFSRSHLEASDEVVAGELLRAAGLRARPVRGQVQVQRWRFARPETVHPSRYLVADALPPLVFAGDAFGGTKVEGAALSGIAAAERATSLLDRLDPPGSPGGPGADR
jgi:predicted NAD/FAD-dependent oxidoreductase